MYYKPMEIAKSLNLIDVALLKMKELVKQAPDTVNLNWKLYAVHAGKVEFWQGDPEQKHKRIQYQRTGENCVLPRYRLLNQD